ncbi:hypothetical protein [Bifidobacterium thermacidophilum]|uniref:hypothetical protein n=1 Tax=Bifidobacterium thermacidophilum TaxID=246618 RepID=UPI003F0459A5
MGFLQPDEPTRRPDAGTVTNQQYQEYPTAVQQQDPSLSSSSSQLGGTKLIRRQNHRKQHGLRLLRGDKIDSSPEPSHDAPVNESIVDSIKHSPKILIATYVLLIVGIIGWITPMKPLGGSCALIGIIVGIVSLIKNRNEASFKRNSIISIILCIVALFGCVLTSPSSSSEPSATSSQTSQSSSVSPSASTPAASSAEASSSSPTPDPELLQAQQSLQAKITEAGNLLSSSENQVADDSTRTALTQAIDNANAVSSTNPADYAAAEQSLQSAMDAVQSSEAQKQASDAAAQQAAQEQAQRQAAQEQAQHNAARDTQTTTTNTGKTVKRGQFCSKSRIGETAAASNGGIATCTSEGPRARWK